MERTHECMVRILPHCIKTSGFKATVLLPIVSQCSLEKFFRKITFFHFRRFSLLTDCIQISGKIFSEIFNSGCFNLYRCGDVEYVSRTLRMIKNILN